VLSETPTTPDCPPEPILKRKLSDSALPPKLSRTSVNILKFWLLDSAEKFNPIKRQTTRTSTAGLMILDFLIF
jgi:hypothetical protein